MIPIWFTHLGTPGKHKGAQKKPMLVIMNRDTSHWGEMEKPI